MAHKSMQKRAEIEFIFMRSPGLKNLDQTGRCHHYQCVQMYCSANVTVRLNAHIAVLFPTKGGFALEHKHSAVLCLCPICSARLQCHPVPAVMGKGCGRASHQYSATIGVQTHKHWQKNAYSHRKEDTKMHANTNIQRYTHYACKKSHIDTLIG